MLTIVFDLDGTLIDTAPDLVHTLNHVLAEDGLPVVPFERARALIGGGAKTMIERALATEGRRCSPMDIDRLYGAFVTHYSKHLADRSRPFPHLEPTLLRLTAEGYRLAVCTNKLERLSKRLLDTLHLSRHFAAICGQDTFGVQKPDPEMLRATVELAGGDPLKSMMVGDSATDVRTARGAGVPVIAVDFGYTDVPIASVRPDRVISSFDALPAAIADLRRGKYAIGDQHFISQKG